MFRQPFHTPAQDPSPSPFPCPALPCPALPYATLLLSNNPQRHRHPPRTPTISAEKANRGAVNKTDGDHGQGPHYVPIIPEQRAGVVVPLYNMLPEAEQWRAVEGIVYQSRASLSARAHFAACDVTVPKTYVVCARDIAAAPQFQRAWAEASGCRVVEIESDHSPFMEDGRARQVLDIIIDVAGQ